MKLNKTTRNQQVLSFFVILISLFALSLTIFNAEPVAWAQNNNNGNPPPGRFEAPLMLPSGKVLQPAGVPQKEKQTEAQRAEEVLKILKDFEAYMNANVIGQPEAVKGFIDLEWKKRLVGEGFRENPEVVYLLGLPATGKDTLVRAYINAIYHDPKAYKEHVFEMDPAQKEADLWKYFGSNTGYVGSDKLSPLIQWLVKHSGGRYFIERNEVKENPNWSAVGEIPKGQYSPENAVLFVNEFHDWAKDAKNLILKQALERGYFPINNSGNGVAKIYVPVTIVVASNEGIELVTSRNRKGERVGEPLTPEQQYSKWLKVYQDKKRIKDTIKAPAANTDTSPNAKGGVTEELLSRIPDRNIHLMKPLSPDEIKQITEIKLNQKKLELEIGTGDFGSIEIEWTDELVKFIQEFKFHPEEGARQIDNNIEELVVKPILTALKEGKIQGTEATHQTFRIRIAENEDHTHRLEFQMTDHNEGLHQNKDANERVSFSIPIEATNYNKPAEPLSPDEIKKITQLEAELSQQVFGVRPILKRLTEAVLISEEAAREKSAYGESKNPARSFMFLGLSSTGKTETAKALARSYYGSEQNMVVMDFNQINTVQDLKVKILGTKDGLGNSIKSEFMEAYDRLDGKILFVFDEIASGGAQKKEVLKALYDILREPVVSTFSDRKPRDMSQVKIIMTGNTGEEWYQGIPRNIPIYEQMEAMREVYMQATNNPGTLRGFLENTLSEALLNRIGMNNIFFFAPIDFKTLRQLTQLKISQALKDLNSRQSRWGWNVVFQNKEVYESLISAIETEGFVIWEQGASIDRFIKQEFRDKVRNMLLRRNVPSDTQVVVSSTKVVRDTEGKGDLLVNFHIKGDEKNNLLTLKIKLQNEIQDLKTTDSDQILTAFHEAGHELVRQALFPDKYESEQVTIVPGVAEIQHQWIRYLGIARSKDTERIEWTRQSVIREMAVLLAGEAAEELVSNKYTAGKSNDIMRASQMARTAVLKWGLSEAFGNEAVPSDTSIPEYVQSFSEERKRLFETEVQKLLTEAQTAAKRTLLANYDSHLVPLGIELAEKGDMRRQELKNFYKRTGKLMNPLEQPLRAFFNSLTSKRLKLKWARLTHTGNSRDAVIMGVIPQPKEVADIESIIEKKRRRMIQEVPIPDSIRFVENNNGTQEIEAQGSQIIEDATDVVNSEEQNARDSLSENSRNSNTNGDGICETFFGG